MAETAEADGGVRPCQTGNPRADTLVDLTAAYVAAEGTSARPELTHFPAIALSLLPYVGLATRAEVAGRLADCDKTPRRLLNALARDAIEAAGPILRRAASLTDGDLVDIAANTTPAHALAIARRETLAAPVIDALITVGSADIDALLRDGHAQAMQPDQLDTLAARTGTDDTDTTARMRVPKAANALPDRTLAQLFWSGDAETREAVITVFTRKPTVHLPPPGDRLAALSGSAGPALLQLAQAYRGEDLIAALARIGDIDRADAARILADDGGEPLALALAALGADRETAAGTIAAIAPVKAAARARLVALSGRLPQASAARLMLALAGRPADEATARTAHHAPGVVRAERSARGGTQRAAGRTPARKIQLAG